MTKRSEPPQRLMLDIDPGGDGLSGILRAEGHDYPFAGWLSLLSALGQALPGQGGDPTPSPELSDR